MVINHLLSGMILQVNLTIGGGVQAEEVNGEH